MHFAHLLLALPYLCLAAPISGTVLYIMSYHASINARAVACARDVDSPECGGHQAYKREELDARAVACALDVDSPECGGHQAY
ncbi:uncharacterized protein N7529_002124 [Penicillium soppii]|uniref:uncharacterized protein n=1 Tax=Penicillium soppii TaxID=69789 RepID=UPI002546F5CA|nr:uncharacterized protein N7529_002124 [Penicillium soppii]KAJ5873694.1 hypothetical protein N7529_002124 [Penicillium soppii]